MTLEEKIAEILERHIVRHTCRARLFDSPIPWIETHDASQSLIVTKCWRCDKIVMYVPESMAKPKQERATIPPGAPRFVVGEL